MSTNNASQYPQTMSANIHRGLMLVSYENYAQCPHKSIPRILLTPYLVCSANSISLSPSPLARIHLALSPVITSLSCSSSLRSVARVLVGDNGTEISLINKGRKTNLQTSDDAGLGLLSAE